jgi:hypothetical protein
LAHGPRTEVPYWIHAKVKDSAFSVVVETAKTRWQSWTNLRNRNTSKWSPRTCWAM